MTSRLNERVAVITGAGRGLGREIALAFAAEGANVVIVARTVTELQAVASAVERLGGDVVPVAADVGSEVDVQRFVGEAVGRFGHIDVLVNNAGITHGAAPSRIDTILDVTTEFWDETFRVNCRGPFLTIRQVLPGMVERATGVIINVTSKLANRPMAGNAPYGPSKSALEQLTHIVDAEFHGAGIRANLLHPGGPVATSIFNERYQPYPGADLGSPADIRDPAIWLASDASADVHGAVIDARLWRADYRSASADEEGNAP